MTPRGLIIGSTARVIIPGAEISGLFLFIHGLMRKRNLKKCSVTTRKVLISQIPDCPISTRCCCRDVAKFRSRLNIRSHARIHELARMPTSLPTTSNQPASLDGFFQIQIPSTLHGTLTKPLQLWSLSCLCEMIVAFKHYYRQGMDRPLADYRRYC
jgi:hypothetical protein